MRNYTFNELAEKVGVAIDTIRRTVKKLDLTILKIRTPSGATAHSLSLDDSNVLISYFENKNRSVQPSNENDLSVDRWGYFYIIQLIPEAMPNRVKIGYTDNLENRLRNHQTAAPTAKFLGHWKCKRAWDQAVMDSITRKDCTLVMNEVYEGDVAKFLERAEEYFSVMPDSTQIPLSEFSPLADK